MHNHTTLRGCRWTQSVKRKHSWDFQLDKNLVIDLGWSLHLCITQPPLFTSVIQGWGPRASPLFKRCTTIPLFMGAEVPAGVFTYRTYPLGGALAMTRGVKS
eukprot:1180764-Prorocentrum_minimum.AAC.1